MTESASQTEAGEMRLLAPVREGDTVAGKYLIERTLGFGGMGVVFAARDTSLDRLVAIKFLLPRLASAETAVQRFVREAHAATRITSEHVVKLLEIDNLPAGAPFIVMEYLEGRDLRAVLREEGPLEVTQAVDYLLQALQAVAEGHMKKIVHRDLKPSNLFATTRADGTPLIKVLDFGIAKTLELDPSDAWALTRSEDVRLGSPAYMPPEQLQNPRDVDTRSDIWSLGVTLYELVSGQAPFQGGTYVELITRILSQPPESLKDGRIQFQLPEGLADVISKCLEKDRSHRYADAAELATALAPFGSDDSRLSLHRVTGLLRAPLTPRPSTPVPAPPTVAQPGPLAPCDTTLPVAVEPAQAKSNQGSRRRAGSVPPNAGVGRGKLIALALAVCAIAIVIWRTQSRLAPALTPDHQSPLVTSVSSLRAAVPPAQPIPSASGAPAPAINSTTTHSVAPSEQRTGGAHADEPSPAVAVAAAAAADHATPLLPLVRNKTGTQLLHTVSSAASAARLLAAPPPSSSLGEVGLESALDGGAELSPAGPSDSIEKLIQKRH